MGSLAWNSHLFFFERNSINRRSAFYDQEDQEESALLTIFMYYVQVPSLLQLEILYLNNRQDIWYNQFNTNM